MNHGVYFYEDDTFLIDNVAGFAKEGLERQETVIIVATEQHRSDLRNQTHRGSTRPVGRNISQLCDPGRLIDIRSIHAERLAGRGVVLKSHRSNYSIPRDNKPIRVYGEMVAVLWAEGNALAAIHLERLWNKLGSQRNFTLLCGYPSSAFQGADMDFAFQDVCACHSQIKRARSSPPV